GSDGMKKGIGFIFVLVLTILLTSCGTETLQQKDFADYNDTIHSDDFTGFAYLIYGEDEYLDVLEEMFENHDAHLVYHDNFQASEKEKEQYHDASSDPDLEFPQGAVGYYKNGKQISKVDITSSITKNKGYKE